MKTIIDLRLKYFFKKLGLYTGYASLVPQFTAWYESYHRILEYHDNSDFVAKIFYTIRKEILDPRKWKHIKTIYNVQIHQHT